MRALILLLFLLSSGMVLGETGHPSGQPLRVGLVPFVSTQRLIEDFLPLKEHLERTLDQPVTLNTAPDYITFIARARRYEYDLYLATPNIAALAEAESGYRRISRVTRELMGSFVVRRGSGITRIEDLKGKTVAAPDRLAIVCMLGEELLERHGVRPGQDVDLRYSHSHNNAILSASRGKADAALVFTTVYENTPKGADDLVTIARTSAVPHLMFMGSPKLSEHNFQALRAALLAFSDHGAGKEFFDRTLLGDMTEITDADMKRVTPYVRLLTTRLK